jgi:hypothetical protein
MIDYFIIAHNELLVPNLQNTDIVDYQILLVGNKIQHSIDKNTIICKNLPSNIERYPNLCSYTGWYSAIKNKLYSQNIVSLLEYDIELAHNFNSVNINIAQQQKNNYIISYSNTLVNHYVFYKSTPWLEISLKKIHNIDLNHFVLSNKDQYPFWPTTTNTTMPTEVLRAFIDWFHPMAEIFCHDPLGAYVHERAFFIFCVLNKVDIIYPSIKTLSHQQLRSHQQQDIYGQVLDKYKSLYLESCMVSDYDSTYDKALQRCYETIK